MLNAARVGIAAEGGHTAVEPGERGAELTEVVIALRKRKVAQAEADALVAHGLRGLPLEAADLARDGPCRNLVGDRPRGGQPCRSHA